MSLPKEPHDPHVESSVGQSPSSTLDDYRRGGKLYAYDPNGQTWARIGTCDHVVPQPDLEAVWAVPLAGICHHHSHPDDRGLRPSGLRTLYNAGLAEVWARCASGIAHWASLPDGTSREDFEAAHEKLNGTVSLLLAEDFFGQAEMGDSFTADFYHRLSDRSFCQALVTVGLLKFEALDAGSHPLPAPQDRIRLTLRVSDRDTGWSLATSAAMTFHSMTVS